MTTPNLEGLMSYRQLLAREALQDVPVSRLMVTRFDTTSPDVPLSALIDDVMLPTGQHAFPVMQEGRLVGMICLRDIQKLPASGRRAARVREIMTQRDQLALIAPDEDAFDALTMLARHGVNQLPVAEGEVLRGLIRREDILNWLALHGEEGDEWRAKPQPS